MDIKLICCDVDGTLVRDDKSLSAENVHWIRRACSQFDIKFVIVTGRMRFSVRYLQEQLGTFDVISCLNGTVLYDEEQRIICNHTIPFETQEKILKAYERSHVDLLFVFQDDWYTYERSGYLYSKKLPIYQKESLLHDYRRDGMLEANKYIAMSESKEALLEFEMGLRSLFTVEEELNFYAGKDFIELMPRKINKGTAIDDLIEHYGLSKYQIMAIGDDFNDIEMIAKAGIGVAMGNAFDEVKAVATYITDTNEEDGVAHAIEHLLFS